MDKETTLKLLNRFTTRERDTLAKPFSQELKIGKYLCATDAKIVVLIPETEENKIETAEDLQLPPNKRPPNVNGILPDFKSEDEIVLDFNDIFKLYSDIPIIERFRMDVCDSCDGDGKFTHYGNDYDCKECDEMGEVQTSFLEKVKNPCTVFRFKENNIVMEHIIGMIAIFNNAKPKTFSIVKSSHAIMWFKMDEIFIGCCVKNNLSDEKKTWDIVNVELSVVR